MYRTGNTSWRSRVFFLCTGLFFSWAVYHLGTGSIDPAYYWHNQTAKGLTPADTDLDVTKRILLTLDVEARVGKNRFIYKGQKDGCLLIDVLIPALDKGFAYRHAIPLKKAKHGFNLAGRDFFLIAASRKAARISLLDTK